MNENALKIIKILNDAGHQALFAGGCVRDLILGIPSHDIDIATSALPDEIESLFKDFSTVAVGKAFGVIVVIINDEQFEVATFRSDGLYSDGRHPDSVTFTTLEGDANRRDLTINGIYCNPITKEIIDLVGGQNDLRDKVIRFVGNPIERIQEDALRLMRTIRFSARFGFEIEPNSFSAIVSNAHLIKNVSLERIGEELVKILSVKNRSLAMDLLFSTEIMRHILPEVWKMKGCEQPPEYHKEGDVAIHTKISLQLLPEDASPELLLATLLHDVGKPVTQTFEDRIRFNCHDVKGAEIAEEILRRLKFSNEVIEHVCCMVRNHMKFMCVKEMRTSRLKRFMNLPKFEEHMMLHKVDCNSSHENLENYDFIVEKMKTFEANQSTIKISSLPKIVTGFDLIEMGYKQGPIFRTILDDVVDQQLEDKITDKETAISFIKEKYQL